MPLQNRVDPFGEIHAVAARGLLTGNRGVIHDPATQTLLARRWTTKAWIICQCDFRGRRREVMGRNAPSGRAGWTELFFLDEVTALAAGHRPCFYCRRERALEFARCFAAGQGRATISAPEMDAMLHRERWASGGSHSSDFADVPPGAMVAAAGGTYAKSTTGWLRWSFQGWRPAEPPTGSPTLLTPASTVAVLLQGYAPAWHPTAEHAP
jgi:hypothetical protein